MRCVWAWATSSTARCRHSAASRASASCASRACRWPWRACLSFFLSERMIMSHTPAPRTTSTSARKSSVVLADKDWWSFSTGPLISAGSFCIHFSRTSGAMLGGTSASLAAPCSTAR
uniref:Uncharacterized protein n=1 Tax=Ixodes ricinus TaxID=34613 RepID=A0A6B0ULF7_IXORI